LGAVFLYRDESDVDIESVLNIFQQKGFTAPEKFQAGEFHILLYPKILASGVNYVIEGDKTLFTIGTLIYKGLDFSRSQKTLLDDIKGGSLNQNMLIGNFLVLYKEKDQLFFFTDRSGIQNLFIRSDQNVITTSFLACVFSSFSPMKVNRIAATELLATGSLIGPETIFNEINRFEVDHPENIKGLNFIPSKVYPPPDDYARSYSECVDDQIKKLDAYFDSIKDFANKEGADSGITGGHDSRLIMTLALKHFENISFNTHWRNKKNIEFDSAIELCNKAGVKLKLVKTKDIEEMSREELEQNFENAFLFYDGLIRMHSFWTEEYNTVNYRKKILGNNKLGLSGIGGEQYRNEERMNRKSWNLKDTIKYKVILGSCGNCLSKEGIDVLAEYIYKKIKIKLNLTRDKISHRDFKRYLNEIFIPARLGVRNNAENQLSFFISPFADYYLSRQVYSIVNRLGPSLAFEEEMIKRINPSIASVPSDHGFDFHKGEPLFNKIKSFILDFIPVSFLHKYYSNKIEARNSTEKYENILNKSPLMKDAVDTIRKLNLGIDIKVLAGNPDHMPLLLAMGYLFIRVNKKIQN